MQGLTDEEIDAVWGNANFGDDANKREIIIETLLKHACGYWSSYTAKTICQELGLLQVPKKNHRSLPLLTKKGKVFLYFSLEKRIHPQSKLFDDLKKWEELRKREKN